MKGKDRISGRGGFHLAALVLAGALIVSILAAVTIGSVDLSVGDVYRVVLCKIGQMLGMRVPEQYITGSMSDIVWFVRLPRLVLAVAVGAALSVSGAVMQAVVRNPLADPYVLGVSSGASLGATLAILLGIGAAWGGNYVGIMAFLGAFLVSLGVVGLANLGGRATSVKLVLSGTAISAVCGAFSSFFLYVKSSHGAMEAVIRWTMGSLAAASWEVNGAVLTVTLAGIMFFLTQCRTLNLMLLGDETAATLGTELHRWRVAYLLAASVLVGFAVYAAGIIGFVGLVVPHIVRMLFGTDHRRLIPLSALVGAVFLLWVDVFCRVLLKGQDLPVGIVTAMIGAPAFVYLIARKKYGFGGRE